MFFPSFPLTSLLFRNTVKNDHDRKGNGNTLMNERLLHAQLSWHLKGWRTYCSPSDSLFVVSYQVLVTHCHAIAMSWQKHRHVWDLACFIMCYINIASPNFISLRYKKGYYVAKLHFLLKCIVNYDINMSSQNLIWWSYTDCFEAK